jgi:hypothetical protein
MKLPETKVSASGLPQPQVLKTVALVSIAAVVLFAALLFFLFLVAAWLYFPPLKQSLLPALKQLVH